MEFEDFERINKKNKHPWHDEIRDEIRSRSAQCEKHFGKDNIYVIPNDENPYKYNFDQFMDKYPFKSKSAKHCKFKYMPKNKDIKDDLKRYYTMITHENQCNGYDGKKGIRGVWSEKDINRRRKYENGNCWVSDEDAKCGAHGNSDLLIPSRVKKAIRQGDLEQKVNDLHNKCEIIDGCMVQQTSQHTYDCVRDDLKEKKSKKVLYDLPEDFPFDITSKHNNAGQYLYDWYVGKKHPVPKTSDLIGEGNRCIRSAPQADNEAKADVDEYNFPSKEVGGITFEEFKAMDPKIKENKLVMKTFLKKNYNIGSSKADDIIRACSHNGFGKARLLRALETDRYDNDKEIPINKVPVPENELFGIPTIPQSIVNMLMKNIARNPKGSNRGLLAWFSTGAGKTICATGIMEAFWDTDKNIIFASSLDALAANPPINFYKAALIFPRFQNIKFIGDSKEETLKNIENEFIRRGVRFLSFAKLSNRVEKTNKYKKDIVEYAGGANKPRGQKSDTLTYGNQVHPTRTEKEKKRDKKKEVLKKEVKKNNEKDEKEPIISNDNYVDLDKSILIIDEVHNLFRPEFNQAKQHKFLEDEIADPRKHPRLKTAIMTATPGDNVKDIIKLLNIVRDVNKPPISIPDPSSESSMNKFKEEIHGLVSYFNMNADKTKFPTLYEERPSLAEMSEKQFARYKEAYLKDTKAEHKNFEKLATANTTAKYYLPARKYANSMYNYDAGLTQVEYSAKLPVLLSKIKIYEKDKHYVYSAFYERRGYGGHGVIGIGKQLDKLGYEKFTVAEAVKHNNNKTLPEKKKRYILAVAKDLDDARKGKSVGENLHELLKIYNHAENKNGELIQIMLASNKFNEGIDLKAVKHIHFFEPLVTMASDKQTVGRAVRNCSHADLDQSEWTVKIHRYMISIPMENEVHRSDLTGLEKQLENMENELVAQSNLLGKVSDKNEKKIVKSDVARITSEIKRLKSEFKRMGKLNNDNVKNVEKQIFEESRSRMKDILTMYQAIREAAVDCKIMEEFHKNSEYAVKCHVFN